MVVLNALFGTYFMYLRFDNRQEIFGKNVYGRFFKALSLYQNQNTLMDAHRETDYTG